MTESTQTITPRSWLFVEGANDDALVSAASSGADVIIQELEDFTAPEQRPYAREISADIVQSWKQQRVITGVRVNPLETYGMEDLTVVMAGSPDIIMLPKVNTAEQIARLDTEITGLEQVNHILPGTTKIVPNIELALGLMNTFSICQASPRILACLVASEDMVADLGAERSPQSSELDYIRARFHLECVAAGVLSIDCPYTWTDNAGLEADTRKARQLGYRAKSAVLADHVAVINRILTPSAEEVSYAKRVVNAFEHARRDGLARAEVDGSLIEVPIYLNAKRLLRRAKSLGLISEQI